MKIIHIIQESTWQKVRSQPQYFGDSLIGQGFIHCCLPEQIDFVLNKWFPGREDMLLLDIDTEKLDAQLVFENLEGGEEKFPHIYGPLNMDAVIAWYPSRKNKG
ncbi:MAG: DUF952 domain-containing protein [Pelolinea sp.]|nr:DUF952 domain-containing protein [Pelolinea sp.]